ncbi:MAG: UDP-N-acetylmuramoyl-L-alanine--D-glutamate ligase [Burkholderiales bacterium]
MLDLENRKVLVLGLGDTGLSMTRWLVRHGASVHVADTRAEPPHAARLACELPQVGLTTGGFDGKSLREADLIAISPGVDRRAPSLVDARRRGVPVVGDIELFARALDERDERPKLLAITGSNGKSTVTTMAGDMCRAAALDTVVAGNIGRPVLDALVAIEDGAAMPAAFVLELSSFQLESTASLRADAATVLNLSEDHMDRYAGMAEYAAAKARIFAGDGVQVLNRDDRWSLGMAQPGRQVRTFGLSAPRDESEWGLRIAHGRRVLARGDHDIMPLAELPVAGLHNAANALAAAALCHSTGVPDAALATALRSFRGLPHRLEKINKINDIEFYDDSKGTNVGATVAALNGMAQPVVLIAGGDGKGQDFAPLAPAVAAHARAVVLIGRDAAAIGRVLAATKVPVLAARDMDEAVEMAHRAAQPGDAVLLSPACASYDMFRNYVHRAEAFVAAVAALKRRLA